MVQPNRLLVIDDDAGLRDLLRDVAEEVGFASIAAESPEEFFAAYRAFAPTVIFVDLVMPDVDGVEVLRQLGDLGCRAKIVVMSGMDAKVLATAHRIGDGYGLDMLASLPKPVELDRLERLLATALTQEELGRADLEAAIETDALTLFYQPKVALAADGSSPIVGAEALVRWRHPELGLVSPGRFIPLAESNGLITPLSEVVLSQAIERLSEWAERGVDLVLAVNLPPEMLTDINLPDRLARQLREAGVPPQRLLLEITERAAMSDGAAVMDVLTRFRLKGIGLSMDDFGVGFSSLVDLYRMPFSELKIDQSFVADLGASEEARAIVRAVIGLAHSLNLSVCAEGVETPEAAAFLREHACDKAQGYYFGRPAPAEELEARLGQDQPPASLAS